MQNPMRLQSLPMANPMRLPVKAETLQRVASQDVVNRKK
jgi:hypothetical protein